MSSRGTTLMRSRPCFAEGDLVGVEARPAVGVDHGRAAGREMFQDPLWITDLGLRQSVEVREQARDRLRRVGLGVADQPDRAALDPAR